MYALMKAAEAQTLPIAGDRRRHARRPTRMPGLLHLASWCGEVELQDVSAESVALLSPQPATAGTIVRLKIGLGPMRQAVNVTVLRCQATPAGYRIAGRFGDSAG